MSLFLAQGSPSTVLSRDDIQSLLEEVFTKIGTREKILLLPPDFTRFHSHAGQITSIAHEFFGDRISDIMPALGTHDPMPDWQLAKMFAGVPKKLFREHRWRDDVVTVGEVPAAFVEETTGGIYKKPWPAQLNKLVWEGGHDLIVSIGQVVPHEVIGMANFNKNLFVGTGGSRGINESHFVGAVYGMERMMGRADNPLRRILNYAEQNFCQHLPVVYILTVVGTRESGEIIVRGLFVGDDTECFEKASELSCKVNFTTLSEQPKKIVAYLDPEEFHSTWLGNKSIYRTRMLIADGGELIVLAPEVKTFGEDKEIDVLIRKYGYRTTPEILRFVEENNDLKNNLSAAAHLIHGSSENRFRVTYCPGHLSKKEIESVGYSYADLEEMMHRYHPDEMNDGWNQVDGERIYFVRNPALGLWAAEGRIPN